MKRSCVLLFLLGLAVPGFAQSNYAILTGAVTDSQHLPVAGAAVELTAASTGATRRVVTNQQGRFEAPALLPDDYELKVEASGLAPAKQSLRLEVGQKLALEITLMVGSLEQGVRVTDGSEILQTTDASVGEVIEPTSIRELPLNGRMLIDLVLTVPGAHVGFGAQTGSTNPLYWRPGQRSAVVIGGSRPNANYFLLDGTTNTDPTFNTQNLSPSPDAVQEFKVQTGSYSAEMGGAGGGQINIVTRSGTNQFHGTAYEFLRNDSMDANSFESMGNNHLVQNNFGASFGGPIAHSHTFFFVNYEGFRHAMADPMIDTVPTAAEINGDFTNSGVNIYDPATTQPNPNFDPTQPVSANNAQVIRQQFQFNGTPNLIDPTRINHAAQLFL